MPLTDLPIPPRPARFTPDGAPPGVELRLDAYNTLDDGLPWTPTRPTITPRMAVVHTNGASVESSTENQVKWGRNTSTRQGRNTTKPTYLVGDKPYKVLRSDLRSIANSTEDWLQERENEQDASLWTISIETADMGGTYATRSGINWPTDCGPFLPRPGAQPDDAEIVARILAYESIVWGFPLDIPDAWNGRGVVSHTDPWPYPHFTTVRGKTCPGTTKKRQLVDEILPRARQIAAAWTAPLAPPEVQPAPPTEERPVRYVLKPYTGAPAGSPWFLRWDGTWSYLTGRDREIARTQGLPEFDDIRERYELVRAQVFGDQG